MQPTQIVKCFASFASDDFTHLYQVLLLFVNIWIEILRLYKTFHIHFLDPIKFWERVYPDTYLWIKDWVYIYIIFISSIIWPLLLTRECSVTMQFLA